MQLFFTHFIFFLFSFIVSDCDMFCATSCVTVYIKLIHFSHVCFYTYAYGGGGGLIHL